jgi:hypothetical protein
MAPAQAGRLYVDVGAIFHRGGAATIDDTVDMLKQAGFQDIKITPKDESRELISEWAPGESKNAGDYVVSAYIEAVKPVTL